MNIMIVISWSCPPCRHNAASITVYLGRQSQEASNPNEVSRNVSLIISHPDYGNGNSNDNDIALLHLSQPVNFTNYIQPVCLAAEGSTFNSDTMWVTGWGDVNSGGKNQEDFFDAYHLVLQDTRCLTH